MTYTGENYKTRSLTNRVYTHDDADSLEYRGQAYCLLCLHHYRLIVDPDTEYHQRVYHVELAAGIIKNLEKANVEKKPIRYRWSADTTSGPITSITESFR